MYTVAHSTAPPAMLLLFGGKETSDAEYEGVVRAWQRLYRDAGGRPAEAILVVPLGHAQPNAYWRRRFAEVHGQERGPMHLAMVTESAVIRGVLTAVHWLMPRRANYYSYTFETVEGATERLSSVEGMRQATLRELWTAAQNEMRERSRVSSTAGALAR